MMWSLKGGDFCFCREWFSIKGNINRHVASVHENKKKFKCKIFDHKFCNTSNLKKHVASIHENKKPFRCKIGSIENWYD